MKTLLTLLLISFLLCSCAPFSQQVKSDEMLPGQLAVMYQVEVSVVVAKDGSTFYLIEHGQLRKLIRQLKSEAKTILDLKIGTRPLEEIPGVVRLP